MASSVKNSVVILIGIALNLQIALDSMVILTIYLKNFYLFSFFLLSWVFAAGSFLWLQSRGSSLAVVMGSHCRGFSCFGAWAPGHVGLSSYSTWAQQLRLLDSRPQVQQLWSTGFVPP